MEDFYFSASLIFSILIPLLFFVITKLKTSTSNPTKLPKSYPIFGSFFAILKNRERYAQWTSEIVTSTPSLTFTLHRPFGRRLILTANAANVQHILKSHFHNYDKGDFFRSNLRDFLGDGIFNTDGENWKFQRQVSSHEFNTKSLRKFLETVVDSELSDRLVPVLENAAAHETVLDFQDILQRFAFDNICKIAFGYDPGYLSASLPEEKLAVAFEKAVKLSSERFGSFVPYFWKIKKALNIGSEKQLKIAVGQVREFAKQIIREKKQQLDGKSGLESSSMDDLLSRFLSSGHSDEDFVADIVISFMLAGRDTTSAALTWFFYLLSINPEVESEILREIKEKSEATSAYDEVKEMVYIHASLCESMRLYPPVPVDTKEALSDDVLPDGTVVRKGTRVSYHPYAMGRVEKVWGKDWAEFRPARWLEREEAAGEWRFVNRDSYTYPVFQAGPRICLGKEMAFIQMKRVVAGVLRRFRVVPVVVEGAEPVYIAGLTAKMKGGFPVRIEARAEASSSF
ncbi:UNVERIFIED_CONTAM: cytochrome [Sesamum radiatum]|uniref:Cytochrome n=1 Tax=Sesamum radiatum TaxID=300843 RepID=A0AAW2RXM9_SESRA